MKEKIHPEYYVNADIVCSACGTRYEFGSTIESIKIPICAKCHPFYTGQQQTILDTANKISTFKDRIVKSEELKKRKAEIEAKRTEREKSRVGVIGEKKVTLKDLLKAKKASK